MYNYNNSKSRVMSTVSIMGAISFIIMFISVPLPFMPSFLKLDFSEIPAIITSFALGPIPGLCVVLVKNIIHLLFTSTGGVGEIANFLIGASFVLTAGFIYKKNKTKKGAMISFLISIFCMTIVGAVLNYYLLLPIYTLITPLSSSIISICKSINPNINSLLDIVYIFIIPFNLIKGFCISFITFILYKKLSPIIKE